MPIYFVRRITTGLDGETTGGSFFVLEGTLGELSDNMFEMYSDGMQDLVDPDRTQSDIDWFSLETDWKQDVLSTNTTNYQTDGTDWFSMTS